MPLLPAQHYRVYSVRLPSCVCAPFFDEEKSGSILYHILFYWLNLRLRRNGFQNCSPGPLQNINLAARIKNVFKRLRVLVLSPPNPFAMSACWHWPGRGNLTGTGGLLCMSVSHSCLCNPQVHPNRATVLPFPEEAARARGE